MSKETEQNVLHLRSLIDRYIESPGIETVGAIENFFKELFHVGRVKLWKHDTADNRLIYINNPQLKVSLNESSLTRTAVKSGEIVVENHLRSNKHYVPEIDNPLKLDIRGLLIIPIRYENETVGVIKLFSLIDDMITFPKNIEQLLAPYLPLLPSLFAQPARKTPEADSRLLETIEVLKQERENFKEETAKYKTLLKQQVERANKLELQLQEKDFLYQNELKKKNKEIEALKAQEEDTLENVHSLMTKLQKYEKELKDLQELNNHYKKELHLLKQKEIAKSVEPSVQHPSPSLPGQNADITLKTQKRIEQAKHIDEIEHHNIDKITDSAFNIHQHSRILFDTLLFSLYTDETTETIERILETSEFVPLLLNHRDFLKIFHKSDDKHDTAEMIARFKRFQHDLFNNQIKINVRTMGTIPPSLFLDTVKFSHGILHLLLDLYQFIDHQKGIVFSLAYDNKKLKVRLSAKTHAQNKVFQNIFKKGFFKSDRDRSGYNFAVRLIEMTGGKIDQKIEKDSFEYLVEVTAPVIRMGDYTTGLKPKPNKRR